MAKQSLKIAGIYANLTRISEFVIYWAGQAGLDERETYAVQMAVDEACSNIIQHAYGGEGKGDIQLRCQELDDGLRVTIEDKGTPFDPESVKKPNIEAPLEERDPGGLGLFLMKQLMDEVSFDFAKGGNTLVLVKRRETTR